MTRAEQLRALAARLEAANADDWALWQEANRVQWRDKYISQQTHDYNIAIIDLAQRLNRPDLLLPVAFSWVPERRVWDLSSRSAATSAAAIVWSPEGGPPATRGRSSSPANALGAAALRARADHPERMEEPMQ